MPKKILLQTTIPTTADDWDIARFRLLSEFLDGQRGADGSKLFSVTARDRDAATGPDAVLSRIDASDFDPAVAFRRGYRRWVVAGGLRGHQPVPRTRRRSAGHPRSHGSGFVGLHLGWRRPGAPFPFQDPEADPGRQKIDDPFTSHILWPNYHSGANGDYQEIASEGAVASGVARPAPAGIRPCVFLPAHPHEGAVSAPPGDASARVIATGAQQSDGIDFNIAVAFERSDGNGPAIAQSTFHHFC